MLGHRLLGERALPEATPQSERLRWLELLS
jgi:hypothetical protein